ncbi:hypothetical protein HELRODRAFT_185612 [Helobdella robusta]|uniref:Uncharacterized protein n=1 Tax=Helobdella robusta TaxID=6412 RepID=T1FN14_HELRO|nr:hypothetical protein HELRODRAFT_185612 [Helobdella robusta]ESO03604.1 hypothetical protein HELRODRAFT_185612 [Helobdella robusta]
MNLELLESFGQNYPEDFDGVLDCVSMAVTCVFNKRGTLLAIGCNDGRIVIWDFLTRGIAKVISAHIHPVCSLCWNRSGHKILSASTDCMVSIWDVLSGECDQSYRFPSPVLKVQFHPRDSNQFLVVPMKHAAVLMALDGKHRLVPIDEEGDMNICASFDRRGKHIFTGNAKGKILVADTKTLELVASFRVSTTASSTTSLKSIEFSRRGNCFLVNSADRMVRVYDSDEVIACGINGEPEPIQKLQDLVNRSLWKKCCFSGDGEYIVAGSSRQHSLYIWEKVSGNLVKFLLGTKGEMLLDVVWHPVRPIIASISSGVVSIWSQNQVENWSAFAPDFKELDENVEYEERESEFDLDDEDKEVQEVKAVGPVEENVDVDVTTVDAIAAFVSSDEDEDDEDRALLYLPIAPEVEDAEESWGDNNTPTPEKRRSSGSAAGNPSRDSPPKKKKSKVLDIDLPDAPIDEVHPFFNAKKPQPDKSSGPKRSVGKPPKSSKGQQGTKSESKSRGGQSGKGNINNNNNGGGGDYYKENAY